MQAVTKSKLTNVEHQLIFLQKFLKDRDIKDFRVMSGALVVMIVYMCIQDEQVRETSVTIEHI